MWWWWVAWVAFVVLVIFLPLAYGWLRRGWGPPYPRYYRRRRARRSAPPPAAEPRETDPLDPTVPPVRDRRPVPPGTDLWRWWLADVFWLCLAAAAGWAVYLWVG